MTLSSLPVIVQNFLCFWALLLCFGSMADLMLFARQKRWGLLSLSALCFAAAALVLYILRALSDLRLGAEGLRFAAALGVCPAFLFPLLLLAVSAAAALLYADSRRWRRSHISLTTIKESFDGLPAGVVFYRNDGRCILINHRMNEVCALLTGSPLRNGCEFYRAAMQKDIHKLSDGTAVKFRHRTFAYQGAELHEIIADDITELHGRKEELERDNERAARLAASMKAYGQTIDDTVRRNEILQAKISIHDGMNRMLLATQRAVQEDTEDRAAILKLWQDQAVLLGGEKEPEVRAVKNIVSDLELLASVIGIKLVWRGVPRTDVPEELSLFLLAAREAMANAAKHAAAEHLYIDISEDDKVLRAEFTNDGTAPAAEIQERGGLRNLRARAEAAGGRMEVHAGDRFSLTVEIPKGGN